MDRTSPEIIKDVEKVLERKLSSSDTSDFTEIGGIKYIAEILNSVDTSTEKFIMEELGNKDPVLADEIRKHMFVFDDIAKLDPISIQRFLQDVNSKDLLIALKGSNEEVTNAFYTNMSTRMREIMSEDAKYLRGVRMSDVEESQQNLVALARKLEESGDIFISRGRKDEIIV
jgi:flagellar motor switch protein FliG